MNKFAGKIDKLKDKKIIGILVIAVALVGFSFKIYGENRGRVFKDEYMDDIFVEETFNAYESESIRGEKVNLEVNKKQITVEIKGEVANPDVYILEDGSIVKDLIDIAGGLTSDGDISKINRADKLRSHQLVYIPNKNDSTTTNANGNVSEAPVQSSSDSNIININTATKDELKKISGIGDSKAQKIIDYREKNGGFNSIEDIKNVDGIGEKTFENLKEEIEV